MSEEKFDAIVVGAGVAGCVAAYVLAKEGLDVLVIERGNYAGSKNMTGGRLYAHSLERVMPGFAEEAPVERLVTREKISFITDDDSVTLDYHTGDATLADYWHQSVRAVPDRTCVVDSQGGRYTYAQLDKKAQRLAGWMRTIGVGRGDVVALNLPGWAEFTIAYVAALKLGAIAMPLLPAWREAELSWALDWCEAKVVFTATAFRKSRPIEMLAKLAQHLPRLSAVVAVEKMAPLAPSLRSQEGVYAFEDVIAGAEPLLTPIPADADEVAAVLFTSGTEGRPKGVMLTHNNILASERAYADRLNLTWRDAFLMPAPLGHATGFLHGVTLPFILGGKSLLLDIFRADDCMNLFEAEKATCVLGATPFVFDILEELRQHPRDLSSLRFFLCGGTTIPPKLFEDCRPFGIRLLSIYGSTESSPHSLVRLNDTREHTEETDGCAVDGVEIRVVDDNRHEVPHGQEGEEASRGPQVFVGYWGEPEMTARALDADGWYYSGDYCRTDSEGRYIRITGRKKDIIVRGGENISSREVEDIVLEYPGVREAAVVAMPDERLGERSCACVSMRPGAPAMHLTDLVAFFDGRRVAKYKFPEYLVVLDALPRTSSGKLQKFALARMVRERVAAGQPSD